MRGSVKGRNKGAPTVAFDNRSQLNSPSVASYTSDPDRDLNMTPTFMEPPGIDIIPPSPSIGDRESIDGRQVEKLSLNHGACAHANSGNRDRISTISQSTNYSTSKISPPKISVVDTSDAIRTSRGSSSDRRLDNRENMPMLSENRASQMPSQQQQQPLPYSTMNKAGFDEDLSDHAVSEIYEGCCYKLSSIIALVVVLAVLFMVASRKENFHVCTTDKYDFSNYFGNFENSNSEKISAQKARAQAQGFQIEQFTRKVKNNTIYNLDKIFVTKLKCLPDKNGHQRYLNFETKGYWEPPTYFNIDTGRLITGDQYDLSRVRFNFEFWPADLYHKRMKTRLTEAEVLCRRDKMKKQFEVILMNNQDEKKYIYISETMEISDVFCGYSKFGNETKPRL